MKVLMLGPFCIHTTRQVNWALEKGCEVTLISDQNPYTIEKSNFWYINQPSVRGARLYRMILPKKQANRLIDLLFRVQYRIWWKTVRPDVVHVNWVGGEAYYMACACAKPFLLTVWGSDVNMHFFQNADPEQRYRAGFTLGHADKVVIDAMDMAEKCSLLAGKYVPTELVPLGVDTELFRPGYELAARTWRRVLAIPDAAKVVVSIRALEKRYGHDSILEAFAKALPHLGGEAVLIFRRYNPKLEDEYEIHLRHQAERLGILSKVRWMDSVPYRTLPEVYSLADLVVNFPDYDAFPVTFIEAAACCRPVLSCRLSSYINTFADECFRMVPPQSTETLAKAIIEELKHSLNEALPVLAKARAIVESNYNELISATKIMDLYTDLSKAGKP